jgi:hypothetical protein
MLNRFAHALLVATALAPVILVYGLSYLPKETWLAARWVGIAAGLVLACVGVLRAAAARGEREQLQVSRAKNVDREVLAFLVSYALPLVSPKHAESSAYAFWALVAILAAVLYQAELVHVNPLLGILGYRFYEVARDDGDTALLITRSRAGLGATRTVIRLSSRLWLESPHAR